MSRNATIDVAKGLGIMLVVLGHNWIVESTKGELFRVVFSFHLPLFLFLSGVFLRSTDTVRHFVESRMHSLLKPYFVVLLAIGAAKLAGWSYFEGVLYATGRTLYWIPMWYLPHLFIASLAALLVIKAVPSARLQGLVIAASLAVGVYMLRPTDWPWSADLVPISAAFLLLGYACRDLVATLRFRALPFALAAAAFAALHAAFEETIDINIRLYGQFFVATAQALLGIYLCLAVSAGLARVEPARRLLAYVGSGTLFILIFHTFFQWKTFNVLSPHFAQPLPAALIGLVAGIALPLLLWEIVKRSRWLSALMLPASGARSRAQNRNAPHASR